MDRIRHESEDVNLSRVPVFVFPTTVYFDANDRDHLKQILTIYNPYDFPIRFKVLCTAPNLYTVIDPDGSIKSKNCVDLILRISSNVPVDSTAPLEHKFRVQIYHHQDRTRLLGRRDVSAIIHCGNLPPHLASGSDNLMSSGLADAFQNCPSGGSSGGMMGGPSTSKEHPSSSSNSGGMGGFLPPAQQPNYVVIVTALVCIVGLMLPISTESCAREAETSSTQTISSFIPTYLHLTVNQKLLFAYALGLVTLIIFRP